MIATSSRYIFTVSEVNQFIKDLLDNVPPLQEVLLRGELSNYKLYPSGHHYFTLKDSQCSLKCVMFRGSAVRLRFRPENGMQVIASGRISVYPRDGAYQLYCTGLTPEGAGDLSVAFARGKQKSAPSTADFCSRSARTAVWNFSSVPPTICATSTSNLTQIVRYISDMAQM